MKRLLIAVTMAATLSGCAAALQNAASKETNEHVLSMVKEWHHDADSDLYQVYYKEMKYREAMGRMNAANDEAEVKQQAQLDWQIAEQKAEQERIQAAYDAAHPQPSLLDNIIAAEVCDNNPVRCRTHVVDSTLNNAGW
ncbi:MULTISPECIES: hypothetical protein [Leclercia]|uniref:hypothetical protein n=1 Tax=Leclercia TaxID=83654 RepID=UPI0012E0C917|nr:MULTISPECIES: hypothetical protein [Leclercia]QGU15009.1 hypothetical protein GNG27_10175 [Leclercia sp. 119287]